MKIHSIRELCGTLNVDDVRVQRSKFSGRVKFTFTSGEGRTETISRRNLIKQSMHLLQQCEKRSDRLLPLLLVDKTISNLNNVRAPYGLGKIVQKIVNIFLADSFASWNVFKNNQLENMRGVNQEQIEAILGELPELAGDREFLKRYIPLFPSLFNEASEELQNDKVFVCELMQLNGAILEFAVNFQNDRDVVAVAVEENGRALFFAIPELKTDLELLKKALIERFDRLGFRKNQLNLSAFAECDFSRFRREEVLEILDLRGEMLQFFPAYQDDNDLVLNVVRKHPLSFQFASERLRDQEFLAHQAIRGNASCYNYVSQRLQEDSKIRLQYQLCTNTQAYERQRGWH